MTQVKQVYRCEVCGNIVEVLHAGKGELVCCNQPMRLLEGKVEEQGKEKHLPVKEEAQDKIIVKVGSLPHPMEENHYIEWIEVQTKDASYKKFLKPGDVPQAEFCISGEEVINLRAYCNVHGLWNKKEA